MERGVSVPVERQASRALRRSSKFKPITSGRPRASPKNGSIGVQRAVFAGFSQQA
jgi:hypothetical protein